MISEGRREGHPTGPRRGKSQVSDSHLSDDNDATYFPGPSYRLNDAMLGRIRMEEPHYRNVSWIYGKRDFSET